MQELKHIFNELVIEHSEVEATCMEGHAAEEVHNIQKYRIGEGLIDAFKKVQVKRQKKNTSAGLSTRLLPYLRYDKSRNRSDSRKWELWNVVSDPAETD